MQPRIHRHGNVEVRDSPHAWKAESGIAGKPDATAFLSGTDLSSDLAFWA